MYNVLIVYDLIPDEKLVFNVPWEEMKTEWLLQLEIASNCVANSDDMNSGLDWIMQATSSKKEYCDEKSIYFNDACCLNKWRVELVKGESLKGPFSKVYFIGFML